LTVPHNCAVFNDRCSSGLFLVVIKLTTELPQSRETLIGQWPYINQFSSLPLISLIAHQISESFLFSVRNSAPEWGAHNVGKQIYFQVQFPIAIELPLYSPRKRTLQGNHFVLCICSTHQWTVSLWSTMIIIVLEFCCKFAESAIVFSTAVINLLLWQASYRTHETHSFRTICWKEKLTIPKCIGNFQVRNGGFIFFSLN